jgi:hypothetical protein
LADGVGGRAGCAAIEGRKVFFFEKKKQKTFDFLAHASPAAYTKGQKFFASFFQKRRPSLTPLHG